jgi:hypothetical protein
MIVGWQIKSNNKSTGTLSEGEGASRQTINERQKNNNKDEKGKRLRIQKTFTRTDD